MIAPGSRLGVLTDAERQAAVQRSTVYGFYEKTLDRESAYEKLRTSVAEAKTPAQPQAQTGKTEAGQEEPQAKGGGILGGAVGDLLFGRSGPRGGKTDGLVQASAKSLARTIGSTVGRQIVRGILGSLLGGKNRRARPSRAGPIIFLPVSFWLPVWGRPFSPRVSWRPVWGPPVFWPQASLASPPPFSLARRLLFRRPGAFIDHEFFAADQIGKSTPAFLIHNDRKSAYFTI